MGPPKYMGRARRAVETPCYFYGLELGKLTGGKLDGLLAAHEHDSRDLGGVGPADHELVQDKVHRRRRVLIGLGHSQREHAVGKFDALDRGLGIDEPATWTCTVPSSCCVQHSTGRGRAPDRPRRS
ncbi:MAG: hypothetical protein ACLTSX_02110 [Collinsella sp.]